MAANQPFVSPWPPYPLALRRTQNNVSADASTIQTLAGNAATMVGHVNGTEKVGDSSNPAPLAPSGQRGHDHSGGYFGRPFVVSLGTWYFGDHRTWDAAAPSNDIADIGGGMMTLQTPSGGAGVDNRQVSDSYVYVYVPNCDPEVGAYRQLGFQLYVDYVHDRGATAMQAGDRVDISIRNAHMNAPIQSVQVYTAVLSGHDSSGQKLIESTGGIELFPGTVNRLKFQLRALRDGTAGERYPFMEILTMEIGVLP